MIIKIYYLYLYIFIFIIFYFKLSFSLFISEYIHISIKLENENFLLITRNSNRYYIVDSSLTKIIQINSDNNYYGWCNNEIVEYFSKEDEGYILLLSCNRIYVFSKEGYYLTYINLHYDPDEYDFSIIPYKHEENIYYFYHIYIIDNTIYFNNYYFNNISNICNFENSYPKNLNNISYERISCKLMKYLEQNVISCFIITNYDNNIYINLTTFNINNYTIENYQSIKIEDELSELLGNIFTSIESEEKHKILGIFTFHNYYLYYIGYDNNNNSKLIYNKIYIKNNQIYYYYNEYNNFILNYFKETEEFIFSFYGYFNKQKYYRFLYFFDNNFNITSSWAIDEYLFIKTDSSIKYSFYWFDKFFYPVIYYSPNVERYFMLSIEYNNEYNISILYLNKNKKNIKKDNICCGKSQ